MNRAQRRAAKYNKPRPVKTYRLHKVLNTRAAFEQIDRLIDTIDTGEWLRYDGAIYVKRATDEYYDAVAALSGFVEFWQAAEKRFALKLQLEPLRQLITELDKDAGGVSNELLDETRQLMAELKQHYTRLPLTETRRLAYDVEVAQILDDKKIRLGKI